MPSHTTKALLLILVLVLAGWALLPPHPPHIEFNRSPDVLEDKPWRLIGYQERERIETLNDLYSRREFPPSHGATISVQ